MMTRNCMARALFIAMLTTLIFPLLLAEPVSPALAGTFRVDRQASDDIDEAIEHAVSRTNFLIRAIARGRLHKTNPLIQQLVIAFPDAHVSVANDGHPAMVVPVDGMSVKWTRDDGETFDVRVTLQNGTLTTTYVAEDGTRTNTYTPTADGKGMTMHVTITSPHLPQPLRYRLAFVR